MAPELLGVAVFCAGGELLARVGEAEPLAPPGAPGEIFGAPGESLRRSHVHAYRRHGLARLLQGWGS